MSTAHFFTFHEPSSLGEVLSQKVKEKEKEIATKAIQKWRASIWQTDTTKKQDDATDCEQLPSTKKKG